MIDESFTLSVEVGRGEKVGGGADGKEGKKTCDAACDKRTDEGTVSLAS
jgi:hypothetical protein